MVMWEAWCGQWWLYLYEYFVFSAQQERTSAVLQFKEDVLNAMKGEENLDDMAIFSLQPLGFVCNRQQLTNQPMLDGLMARVFNLLEAFYNVLSCMHVVT